MNTEKKSNRSAFKQGVLGFVITFILMVILLTIMFLTKDSNDIFNRNLDFSIILEVTFYGLISMVALSLPVSVLVMTIVYYRQLLRQGQKTIRFKNSLLFSIPISIVCFIWLSFVSPINNLHMLGLVYDIRCTAPDEPLVRNDITLFKDSPMANNYFQVGHAIDSLKTEQSSATEYDMRSYSKQIAKWQMKRAEMTGFPFRIFILFYFGMSLGILNRQNKLVYILLGVYFLVLPIIYYLPIYFDNLARQSVFSPAVAQFIHLLILAVLTVVLFLCTKRKKQNVNPTTTPVIPTEARDDRSVRSGGIC